MGRVGVLAEPMTLRQFAAARSPARCPSTAQGVRVAGDPDAVVQRVAVVGGVGRRRCSTPSRGRGADVYVTADLRHHPASEQRERAEFDAAGRRDAPYLVDVAHWATEWPWLAGGRAT